MGLACAEALAAEGARVAVVDRNATAVEAVCGRLAEARPFVLDVRDAAAVEETIAAVEASLGPIDHLVSTAGIFRAIPAFDTTDDEWRELLNTNVMGPVALLRAVGKRMKERRAGSIVIVASQSAKVVRIRQAAYGASKAALTYAAKTFGLELAPFGVRVNVVQPGTTDTPMARELWDAGKGSAAVHISGSLESFRAPIPLGKVGVAEDVSGPVLFLLSDAAGHITMSEILVDGGSSYLA